WFAGQEFGNALMDLITGKTNPSGKLPITFPRRMSDTPAYTSYPGEFGKVYYGEGLFVGYRWYDCRDIEPLLPFGFGLSYTSFEFADMALTETDDGVRMSCSVTNTGQRKGMETIQVYVEPVAPSVARPVRELKAFTKVELEPGVSTTVEVLLDSEAFAHWDIDAKGWQVAAGEYRVHVGNSSRDLPLVGSVAR
ncbi:MAG: beta-glucosidase, partial [Sulfitobacter sp.]